MSTRPYSGGQSVKVSTLSVGDYVRDPKRSDRIMVVVDVGNPVFIQGNEVKDKKYHRWVSVNDSIIKVTNV